MADELAGAKVIRTFPKLSQKNLQEPKSIHVSVIIVGSDTWFIVQGHSSEKKLVEGHS